MRSVYAPLLLGLVLSLAVMFGVQWTVTRAAVDAGARELILGHARDDAEELRDGVTLVQEGEPVLALSHFDPVYLSPKSGRYFQIMLASKVVYRSRSLAGATLPVGPLAPGESVVRDIPGPHGEQLLSATYGYELDGQPLTIALGIDLAPIQAGYGRMFGEYIQVTLLMFALLVALQFVIVRFALAPLRRAAADVGRLERGETAQLSEDVPVEVLPLVREINQLLARLALRLQASRESLGNLAHALKAPLAVLTQMTQDDHIRGHRELSGEMADQLGMLRDRIDSEMRRARVAGARIMGPGLDISDETEGLLTTMCKLYPHRKLEITSQIEAGLKFPGDREDMLEICGNLLDNACKWARTRVVFSVTRGREGGVRFAVEDDGAGCSEQDLHRLACRGVRLDEAAEGHGLGLSIVRTVAESYGATLTFGRSAALGGFRAVVAMPPA